MIRGEAVVYRVKPLDRPSAFKQREAAKVATRAKAFAMQSFNTHWFQTEKPNFYLQGETLKCPLGRLRIRIAFGSGGGGEGWCTAKINYGQTEYNTTLNRLQHVTRHNK